MKLSTSLLLIIAFAQSALAFVVLRPTQTPRLLFSLSTQSDDNNEKVGNLVADDEWNGLSLELAEVIRLAVVEDLKKNTREFLGKDEYKVGDLSKEIDARVKQGGACVCVWTYSALILGYGTFHSLSHQPMLLQKSHK